ncbi:MAG: YceI family protein [Bacteroidetes bacterium]|nr:MAG: YceI family protein [Bacteroidota bacterium]
MKRKISVLFIAFLVSGTMFGQNFVTKTGHIKFYSDTPIETIEANNHAVNSALNPKTGDFVFKILIKSFEFEKALMQEHFNENYMESDKYPNAMFKGKVVNAGDIDFGLAGTNDAIIKGDLTIHGITKAVEENGTFTVKDGKIHGQSVFSVLLEDYKIKVPGAVKKQISESIEVTVDVMLEEVKP